MVKHLSHLRRNEGLAVGVSFFMLFIIFVLGINVTGLIAGLGIMGFIVGFALKDTLGNLASGVFILFHKPFKVGDWIKIGGIVGGVERMGIAACVLKSPDNVKITVPNSKIWGDVIKNVTDQSIRRVDMVFGISYSGDIPKTESVLADILKSNEKILDADQGMDAQCDVAS